MGIILAKAKTFRKTGANENIDVTKRTSGIGQYLSEKVGHKGKKS
jgi:hypothetical protein